MELVLDKEMRMLDSVMQKEVAKAETEMRSILERALATGAATPVK